MGQQEKNKVEFGLENVYFARATTDLLSGATTYEKPIRWPGAVELSLEASGDLIKFKADNIDYYISGNNQGYDGKLTTALVPEEFADFSDPYNLVYGHNMKNGGMFADVVDFTNKEYFETHQKGKLYLTDATRKIRFFACMKVTAADAKIYHPDGYRKENLKDLLDYIQANAVQYRDVNVADENSLIALSTCSEAETNGRVVLIGKLEREVAEKQ